MTVDRMPSCRRRSALVLLLSGCLALPALGGDADELRAAARTWRAAAPLTPAPSEALPGWTLAEGRAAVAAVLHRDRREAGAWSDPEILAAALLLTASGRAGLEAGDVSDAWFDFARDLLGSVADPSRRRSFERDWTLALAAYHNAQLDGRRSRELLDRAAQALSDEPEVLFAAARLHAAIADGAYSGLGEVVSSEYRDAVQPDLLAAQRLYEQGLRRVPDATAERLRYARVLFLLERTAGARRELETLRAAPADSDVPCLASLLLGAAAEQENRPAEALAAYRAALATGRSPQVARLAIARALRRTGDAGGARRVIEQMLAETPASGDAWWRHQGEGFGDDSDHAARFVALRREAAR
jgi:tetratricopeptide (TPR) repeat protein